MKKMVFMELVTTVLIIAQSCTRNNTLRDADGNVYHTVQIGSQIWTVENLKTTKYNDGAAIPLAADDSAWAFRFTPAYCWYNNDSTNKGKFGALYNWHAVNTGKLAPKGWRVPSAADWIILEKYLVGNGYNWDGTRQENRIAKSLAAATDWKSDVNMGTIGNDLSKNNQSGFSALPGGCRYSDGHFDCAGFHAVWWSTTELDASTVYRRYLYFDYEDLRWLANPKDCGLYIRLVKN